MSSLPVSGTFIYTFEFTSGNAPLDADITTNLPIINQDGSFTVLSNQNVIDTNTNVTTVTVTFTYADNGSQNDGLSFNNVRGSYNAYTNLTISQFGDIPLSRSGRQFANLTSLIFTNEVTDVPTILTNTSLANCFSNSITFNSPIGNWITINVTDMNNMFGSAIKFNQPIRNWITTNVTNMSNMFYYAIKFNQPIGNWNTSNVTDMSNMFSYAYKFNQTISYDSVNNYWNTSNVTNMDSMFFNANNFNNGGKNYDTTHPMNWIISQLNNVTPNNFSQYSNLTIYLPVCNSPFPPQISSDSSLQFIYINAEIVYENATYNMPIGTTSVTILSTPGVDEQLSSSITSINGTPVTGPGPFNVAVINGRNMITITVTAGDNSSSDHVYYIDIGSFNGWTINNNFYYFNYNINFSSTVSSADGTKLAVVNNANGGIYLSSDSGNTWSLVPDNGNNSLSELQTNRWRSITSSSDGNKLASIVYGGGIYLSSDTGITWSIVPDDGNNSLSGLQNNIWTFITSSADGTKLAAVATNSYDLGNKGGIYLSSNSGNTWSLITDNGNNSLSGLQTNNWISITSSSDGNKLASIVGDGGGIYLSSDSGNTWSLVPDNGNNSLSGLQTNSWTSITSSADGNKLAALAVSGIYLSSDSGNTWSQVSDPNQIGLTTNAWIGGISCSSTGSIILAATSARGKGSGNLYISSDSGNSWSVVPENGLGLQNQNWSGVALNADGNKIISVADNNIYTYDSAADSSLSSITVNGNHLSEGATYYVDFGTTSVTVLPTPTQIISTVTSITGDTGLVTGQNTITITVTAQDMTTSNHIVYVNVAILFTGGTSLQGDTTIVSVTIPPSITTIEPDSFTGCTSLVTVTVPTSVTTIGANAFQGCSSLSTITIPSSVTSLGPNTFQDCSSLSTITIPSSVTSLGSNTFQGCTSLATITLPPSITTLPTGTFTQCTSLTTVTLPGGINSIGNNAFDGCTSLRSLTISN